MRKTTRQYFSLNTSPGKACLEAQAKAAGSRSAEALEAAVYSHLYTFFSRYWQDGDFISRRRYSRKERYAIPGARSLDPLFKERMFAGVEV